MLQGRVSWPRELHLPVTEPTDALAEISSRLIFRVHESFDFDFGQGIGYHLSQVLRELSLLPKCRFSTLIGTRSVPSFDAIA